MKNQDIPSPTSMMEEKANSSLICGRGVLFLIDSVQDCCSVLQTFKGKALCGSPIVGPQKWHIAIQSFPVTDDQGNDSKECTSIKWLIHCNNPNAVNKKPSNKL